MQNAIPLSDLPLHVTAVVSGVQPGMLAAKLVEMGFCVGCRVTIRFTAPFGGPLAVDLGAYLLSLRREEAQLVMVEPETAQPQP
jgi:ferrous iron transport protein A